MPIDWKFSTRYDIPHSDCISQFVDEKTEIFWAKIVYFCYGSQKTEFIQNSDFVQKCDIFFGFFISAKSRRTAKRPKFEQLASIVSTPIILRKIYFLINFRNFFEKWHIFSKNGKK